MYERLFKASLCFVLCIVMLVPTTAHASVQTRVLADVLSTLTAEHIQSPDEKELAEIAIRAMVESLNDPYTEYFTAEQWETFQNYLENDFVGVGVSFERDQDGFFVSSVLPNSPAEKAGIQVSDYFVAINGVSTKNMNEIEFVQNVTGEIDTFVTLKMKRGSTMLSFKIKRAKISVQTVASQNFGQGIGYLSISSFSSDTANEFSNEWSKIRTSTTKALILDLRNNMGGYLDSALEIAEYFIPNKVLLLEEDQNKKIYPYTTNDSGIYQKNGVKVPVYVLVNSMSASASEAFAGALRDHKKAKIIGQKTYGKGSVQQIYPLENGGAIKVTIRKYLTPNKKAVDKIGIQPDYQIPYGPSQLVKALQFAGYKKLAYVIDRTQILSVNGIKTNERISLLRENGNVFIPVRLLLSMVDNSTLRVIKKGEVEIKAGSKTVVFHSKNGLLFRDGTSYVSLASFVKSFPQIRYQVQQNSISIQN